MLKLNHVEIVIEWDIWSIDSIDPMPVSWQPQPLPSLIETSIRLVRSSSSDSLNSNCWDTSWKGWILGTFFTIFCRWGCIHPPPQKKRELKPPIFVGWLTASQGSQTTPTIHKAMDFLPIEIRAAWPKVQAKSWIPYVLLICHICHISQQKLWGRLRCTSLRQIPFWYVTGFVTA